jgi:outer membrane protein assembly factor BamD (BamD/ComL family)
LGAEQALLDAARTALAQGHAADALSPLEAHARRFPRGLLAEEREALSVNALVTVGRNDEARRRGTRFLQRYPSSLLRPTVEAAIGAASVTD